MADTDESSGTDSSGSDSSGAVSMTSPTTTASTTMTTDPTTNQTTMVTSTTEDPDTSTTDDPPGTSSEATTGECPPGELDCPCDVGSTCLDDLMCIDGTCVAEPACEEPEGEPNDDEASAVELPDVNCGAPAMMATGGLDGAESDWFVYNADDSIACFDNPDAVVTADVDVAVCIFAQCDNGNTGVNCSGGADDDTSPDGLEGCCDQNAVGFGDLSCSFGPFNGVVYVRVTSIDAACVPYELAFDY